MSCGRERQSIQALEEGQRCIAGLVSGTQTASGDVTDIERKALAR